MKSISVQFLVILAGVVSVGLLSSVSQAETRDKKATAKYSTPSAEAKSACSYNSVTGACYFVSYDGGVCSEIGSTQPSKADCDNHCRSAKDMEFTSPTSAIRDSRLIKSMGLKSLKGRDSTAAVSDDCQYNSKTGACLALSCGEDSCAPPVGSSQPSEGDCQNHCDSVHNVVSVKISRLVMLDGPDGKKRPSCQ